MECYASLQKTFIGKAGTALIEAGHHMIHDDRRMPFAYVSVCLALAGGENTLISDEGCLGVRLFCIDARGRKEAPRGAARSARGAFSVGRLYVYRPYLPAPAGWFEAVTNEVKLLVAALT